MRVYQIVYGKIAEVAFWDGELNATDLDNLRTYVNNKYNLGVT